MREKLKKERTNKDGFYVCVSIYIFLKIKIIKKLRGGVVFFVWY